MAGEWEIDPGDSPESGAARRAGIRAITEYHIILLPHSTHERDAVHKEDRPSEDSKD